MNFYVVSKADKLHKYREDDYFGKPLTIIFLESISKLIQVILSCPTSETPLSIPRKQDSFWFWRVAERRLFEAITILVINDFL